jgi:hypothetical protein
MIERISISNQQMRDWLSEYNTNEKKLSMRWDGGGDSGWGELLVDSASIDETQVSQALIDKLLDHMGYMSFDGDPQVSGEIYYNGKEKVFTGGSTESYDDWENVKVNLLFRVPLDVWFDKFFITVNEEDMTVRLDITHGPVTDQHRYVEQEEVKALRIQLDNQLEERGKTTSFQRTFIRSEGTAKNDSLYFNIDEISVRNHVSDEKDFEISLDDLLPVDEEKK